MEPDPVSSIANALCILSSPRKPWCSGAYGFFLGHLLIIQGGKTKQNKYPFWQKFWVRKRNSGSTSLSFQQVPNLSLTHTILGEKFTSFQGPQLGVDGWALAIFLCQKEHRSLTYVGDSKTVPDCCSLATATSWSVHTRCCLCSSRMMSVYPAAAARATPLGCFGCQAAVSAKVGGNSGSCFLSAILAYS